MTTIESVLVERLRSLGVTRVYGNALGDLDHIAVDEPDISVLLADADGRIGHHDGSGRLGAALLDGPILHLSSKPGGTAALQRVTTEEELFDALASPPGIEIPATMALHLDMDLTSPCHPGASIRAPERAPVITLNPAMSGLRIVLLVGPGVIRSSALVDVRELARRNGWGIVNTWGARGVERWDSPFNFATVGLSELDAELGGLLDADLIVASGIDPDELAYPELDSLLVQHVPPRQLGALTTAWEVSRVQPVRPPHHERTSAVLTPMYESESVPLSAPRAALHLSGLVPDGGLIVADPGSAGFWLARSTPTSVPESLCVPATVAPGFAAAAALVASLDDRPCVAVTDQPTGEDELDPFTTAVLELAEELGKPVHMQLWGDSGELESVMSHVEQSRDSLDQSSVTLFDVPVLTADFDGIESALGRTVAWAGWSDD